MIGKLWGGLAFVGSIAASYGAGAIVGEALKTFKPQNLSGIKKAAVALGAIALSGVVADKAGQYVESCMDGVKNGLKKFFIKEEGPVETRCKTFEEAVEAMDKAVRECTGGCYTHIYSDGEEYILEVTK